VKKKQAMKEAISLHLLLPVFLFLDFHILFCVLFLYLTCTTNEYCMSKWKGIRERASQVVKIQEKDEIQCVHNY
jgi:hypothetical protein